MRRCGKYLITTQAHRRPLFHKPKSTFDQNQPPTKIELQRRNSFHNTSAPFPLMSQDPGTKSPTTKLDYNTDIGNRKRNMASNPASTPKHDRSAQDSSISSTTPNNLSTMATSTQLSVPNGSTLTGFHLFAKLPLQLRKMIWKASILPRNSNAQLWLTGGIGRMGQHNTHTYLLN